MIILISAVLAFLFDRISKILILKYAFGLSYPLADAFGVSVPVIEDVFHLTYYGNTGMAFGLLAGNKALLIALCAVILAVIAALAVVLKIKKGILAVCLGMIVGGAVGNVFDRIMYGFVIDYFDFCLIDYPIFNVADCFIVVGAVLLCVYILFFDKKDGNGGKI